MNKSIIMTKARQDLFYIDKITGDQFENLMTKILKRIGFKDIIHTPYSNDGGIDAYSLDHSISWQFKDYDKKRTVPYHAVEEVTNGFLLYKTKTNIVLTNSYFSKNTWSRCSEINRKHVNFSIELIDRQGLFKILKKYVSIQTPVINHIKMQRRVHKKEHAIRHVHNLKVRRIKAKLDHIQYIRDMKLKRVVNKYGNYSQLQDKNQSEIKRKNKEKKHNKIIHCLNQQNAEINKELRRQRAINHKKQIEYYQYQEAIHNKQLKQKKSNIHKDLANNVKSYQRAQNKSYNYSHLNGEKLFDQLLGLQDQVNHSGTSQKIANDTEDTTYTQRHAINKSNYSSNHEGYNEKFESLPYIICPKCQHHIFPHTKFCDHCGYKINYENKTYKLYMIWLIDKMNNDTFARIPIYLYFNYPYIFKLFGNYLVCISCCFIIGVLIGHIYLMVALSILISLYFNKIFDNYREFINKF